MTLPQLLARVEAATGPDRALDLDIARTLAPDVIVSKQYGGAGSPVEAFTYWKYTESVNAILALIDRALPGAWWRVEHRDPEKHTDWATCGPPGAQEQADAATPALALCAALLKAKIAETAGDASAHADGKHEGEET